MSLRIGLFLSCPRDGGGMHQYAQALLEALALLPKPDFEVVAVCNDTEWMELAEQFGVPATGVSTRYFSKVLSTIVLRSRTPTVVWRRLFAPLQPAYRRVRSLGCDLWLFPAHDRWSYLWPLRAVPSVHDLMHRYESRFPEMGGIRDIRDQHFLSIGRHCRALLVDSECGRRQFCETYDTPADRVLPLPYVAPPHIRHEPNGRRAALPEGLPSKFLFYPAQFWPHKNHSRLIEAVQCLASELPDIQLVLAGGKSREYPRLLAQAGRLGLQNRVHFLGYVPDEQIRELYRAARALVMPTFFGPTNIPPLEAFALGCPAAVSGIYGMPEQVGDAALLFDPESISSLCAAIRRLWTDDQLCQTLAARGLAKAARWNVAALSERLQSLLPELCRDRTPQP